MAIPTKSYASMKPASVAPVESFNKFAAGAKHYGTGRSMPNIGKTANKTGYAQRDAQAAARKNALLRRSAGGMK